MADLIPVIRGGMGGRQCYIGKMTFGELADKVQSFNELETSRDLDALFQRELSRRSQDMTDYLLRQPERFYGAITVTARGGRPAYIPVKMQDCALLDGHFDYGLLRFDGKQEYFALDGQHRLRSIKDAIERDADLGREEVSVIFVTHEHTEEENVKTRRLFHTLNRYARPTTTGENIQLDEDNVVSISTRMLLNSGMKSLRSSNLELVRKNLTATQRDKFTSLAALYDFNFSVLEAVYSFKREKDYLRYRPDASHVEHVFGAISSLWIEIRRRFDEFRALESEARTPGDVREPDGDPSQGHLLFRPLGLRIYGQVLAHALSEEDGLPVVAGSELDPAVWERALDRVKPLPLTLGSFPWKGTVFRNNKMETGARTLAFRVACYMLDLGRVDSTKLLEDYRGHLDDETAELPLLRGA